MFQVVLSQTKHIINIRHYLGKPDPFKGFIGTKCRYDYMTGRLAHTVDINFRFNEMTIDRAKDTSDLLALAVSTAQTLETTIKTASDFDRVYTARVVGRTVVIDTVASEE